MRREKLSMEAVGNPVEQNIEKVVELHLRTELQVDPHQRRAERITAWLGRPRFLYISLLLIASWIGFNLWLRAAHLEPVDPPPFSYLAMAVSVVALLITTVVLITQNRQGKMAARREHLALQMSLLTDQRTAKLISLIEELRRDLPSVRDRVDHEAEALRQAANPEIVLSTLEIKLEEKLP